MTYLWGLMLYNKQSVILIRFYGKLSVPRLVEKSLSWYSQPLTHFFLSDIKNKGVSFHISSKQPSQISSQFFLSHYS